MYLHSEYPFFEYSVAVGAGYDYLGVARSECLECEATTRSTEAIYIDVIY